MYSLSVLRLCEKDSELISHFGLHRNFFLQVQKMNNREEEDSNTEASSPSAESDGTVQRINRSELADLSLTIKSQVR